MECGLIPLWQLFRAARVTLLTFDLDAQSAANTIQNHPATQSVKDTVGNGPVADHVKDQHAKTTSEFRNLADSRTTPEQSTATGQPLTRKSNILVSMFIMDADSLGRLPLVLLQSPKRMSMPFPCHPCCACWPTQSPQMASRILNHWHYQNHQDEDMLGIAGAEGLRSM